MKQLTLSITLLLIFATSSGEPLDQAKLSAPLPANLWSEMSRLTQPGVVGIYLDVDIKKSHFRRDPFFDFVEEFLGHGFEYELPEETDESKPIGTGFIIDNQGHIITNYHVIEATQNRQLKTKLQVQIFGESQLHEVTVLGHDARGDLALLKLKKPLKNLKPLELGDSDSLKVGEFVAAFGNPYGHSNSMTVGIISAKGRAIKELNRFPFMQTDASINPGNSGGPLLNTKGYVIGVNTAIDARAQGIGFAIPASYVKKVIGILKSGGTIQRAFLGIGLATLHPRVARSYGIQKTGVVVTGVEPGLPAAQAGLRPNDIIYEFEGKLFDNTSQFINMVQDSEVGKSVTLKILRPTANDFTEKTIKVTLTNYPKQGNLPKSPTRSKIYNEYPGQAAPYELGFSAANSSSGARRYYDVPVDFPFAPIVSRVTPGSPAEQASMAIGNLILEVNGNEVHRATDVIRHIKKGNNQLTLKQTQGEVTISLKTE